MLLIFHFLTGATLTKGILVSFSCSIKLEYGSLLGRLWWRPCGKQKSEKLRKLHLAEWNLWTGKLPSEYYCFYSIIISRQLLLYLCLFETVIQTSNALCAIVMTCTKYTHSFCSSKLKHTINPQTTERNCNETKLNSRIYQ